jgi:uncharacterized protein YaiE (UPF0345 family)
MSATSHNTYFDGGVQSLGFERVGQKATVGVIQPGAYQFDTGAPERMTVVSGELEVLTAGADQWRAYARGTTFDVPGSSSFQVRAAAPSAYLCEFL